MDNSEERDTLIIEDSDLASGFTQIPNWLLYSSKVSRDSKILYALLLSYAWQKDRCFPGYTILQKNMGSGSGIISKCLTELKDLGLITVQRRGQGKTSIYTIKKGMAEKFRESNSSSSQRAEQELPNQQREEYSKKKASSYKSKKTKTILASDDVSKYFTGKFGHIVQH